jgi:uncharacterized repeat protein (TIGR01451 family)
MRSLIQSLRILLPAALLVGAFGCGFSHNPSYFPYFAPPGDIIRTHAKPSGEGYFADFDPHAQSLVVRPEDGTSPVRSSVVVIATIYDEKGQPRRNRRVEWMLEGAGNIVEVDESGYFPGRGYKVDNKYAVSYTDYFEHRITRGNDNPNDDFAIRPGQSWCVITSSVEGDTHLTVYAPEIHNWEKGKIHINYHWVDAQWATPPAVAVPTGAPHLLTTNITRHTDHQPLAGYRVRYRILDGPPAVFLPSRTSEAVAVSDLRGNAGLQLVQQQPGPGSNRIAVEIIRAPDPTATSAPGIVIGHAETRVDWQSPELALALTGPPSLALGQESPYTITLTNPGQLPLKSMTVRYTQPQGVQYVRSNPPVIIEGDQLIWTLGELAAGGSRDLSVTFRQQQPVRVDHRVTVASEEGLRDEKSIPTLGTQPGLKMALTGPATGAVGVPIPYRVTLTNPGSGPATNIMLRASFDAALEADSGANPLDLQLSEPLAPGQSRDIPLSLKPKSAGTAVVRVTVTADGGLTEQGQHAVDVRDAKVGLSIAGPLVRFAGRPQTWSLEASNSGATSLANVAVRQQLPPEVEFVSATEDGRLTGREIAWNLGTLKPGERRSVKATVNAVALTAGTKVNAQVTGQPEVEGVASSPAAVVRADAETTLEIRGIPAFRMEVNEDTNPVQVGGHTRYRIEVTNQGSLRGSQVQVTATIPKQMKFISADGGPVTNKLEGDRLTFAPRDGLEPQQTWIYTVELEAAEAGDARFQAELRAATLGQPVIVQQSTSIFAPIPTRPLP